MLEKDKTEAPCSVRGSSIKQHALQPRRSLDAAMMRDAWRDASPPLPPPPFHSPLAPPSPATPHLPLPTCHSPPATPHLRCCRFAGQNFNNSTLLTCLQPCNASIRLLLGIIYSPSNNLTHLEKVRRKTYKDENHVKRRLLVKFADSIKSITRASSLLVYTHPHSAATRQWKTG